MMVTRHLAWFNVQTGAYIGEWQGLVPTPLLPPSLIGDARLMVLNEWLQQVQRVITPSGSPYPVTWQSWDLDAWDDCPDGGAVCLDVTMYQWPVGDFVWAQFDDVDRRLDFREMRKYLEITTSTLMLDANHASPRPVRSTPDKAVIDITGTPLGQLHGRLFGRLVKRDGTVRLEGHPHIGVQRVLEAARVDLTPVREATKEMVHR